MMMSGAKREPVCVGRQIPLTGQRAAAGTAFIRACTTCGRSLVDRGPQPDSVAKERLHDNNIPLFAGKEPKLLIEIGSPEYVGELN